MYQVKFLMHLHYTARTIIFVRSDAVPFVPFVGLEILDEALGEFRLEQVTWIQEPAKFVCRSSMRRHDWPLHKACRSMQKAGWVLDGELKRTRGRMPKGDK
jgi:hypothetical protein